MMKTVFALVLVAFISSTKTLAASNNIRGSDTVVLDEIGEEFGSSSSTQLGKMMMMTTERKLQQQRRGLAVGGISSESKKKREKGGEKEKDTRTKLVKKENESKSTKPSGGTWFKEPKAGKNGKIITVKESVTKDGKPYGATKAVKQKQLKAGGKFEKFSKDDGSYGAKPVSPYGPW